MPLSLPATCVAGSFLPLPGHLLPCGRLDQQWPVPSSRHPRLPGCKYCCPPHPHPHVCSVRLTLCRAELLPERTLRVQLSPTGLVLLLPSLTGQNVREPRGPFQEALRLLSPEGNPRPAHQRGWRPGGWFWLAQCPGSLGNPCESPSCARAGFRAATLIMMPDSHHN